MQGDVRNIGKERLERGGVEGRKFHFVMLIFLHLCQQLDLNVYSNDWKVLFGGELSVIIVYCLFHCVLTADTS